MTSKGSRGSGEKGTAAPGHETRDVDVRGVGILVAAVLAVVVLFMGLMIGVFGWLEGRESARQKPPASLAGTAAPQPPEPRLQNHPVRDLDEMRAEEDRQLAAWGWVDREAGIVRMPIEDAMARVVERGLPVRPDAGGGPPEDSATRGEGAP